MNRSRIQWICGVLAAFMAVAASADPPTHKFNNRTYGNSVDGGSCAYLDNRYLCRAIHVWENYDVKGTFEYTEASFETWRYSEDPSDGSWEYAWRVLTCPVDEKSISAHPNRVTIDVLLDTEGPGCSEWGERFGWNPGDGDYWFPFTFSPGIRIISGDWLDPFSYGSSMWNVKDKFYDGWSGMTFNGLHHCKSTWGDMMTRGGFTTISPSGATRSYEFDGPNGPAWGSYNVSSCNDNEIQQ